MILDDRAVYEPMSGSLILADLHLDYQGSAEGPADGAVVPPTLVPRYRALLNKYDPNEVIFAGDLFETTHEPPEAAAEAYNTMCDLAYDRGIRVIVTPGNHERRGVDLLHILPEPSEPEYRLQDDRTVVLHGNRNPEKTADRFVVGHMHPMVTIDGQRMPCYLVAPEAFDGADVWVLPPFNPRVHGLAVQKALGGRANTPIVRKSLPFDSDATRCIGWDTQAGQTVSKTLSELGL